MKMSKKSQPHDMMILILQGQPQSPQSCVFLSTLKLNNNSDNLGKIFELGKDTK